MDFWRFAVRARREESATSDSFGPFAVPWLPLLSFGPLVPFNMFLPRETAGGLCQTLKQTIPNPQIMLALKGSHSFGIEAAIVCRLARGQDRIFCRHLHYLVIPTLISSLYFFFNTFVFYHFFWFRPPRCFPDASARSERWFKTI